MIGYIGLADEQHEGPYVNSEDTYPVRMTEDEAVADVSIDGRGYGSHVLVVKVEIDLAELSAAVYYHEHIAAITDLIGQVA